MVRLYKTGTFVLDFRTKNSGGNDLKGKIILGVALVALIAGPLWARGNREEEPDAADADTAAVGAQDVAEEELVARVNGRGVPREEFDELVDTNVSRYEMQSNQELPRDQLLQLQRQILEGLITRTVLEAETDRLGITLSEERFADTLAQFKTQFPHEDAYRSALLQQGFTEERFERELRRQLIIEELINTQVLEGLSVDDAELREFYQEHPEYFQRPEQVSARHIIITTRDAADDSARAEKRRELETIRGRIVAGEDFGEMARQYSQDGSAPDGGRLGTFGRGQMVPEFEAAAFSLDVGELSEIVETQFGYHLVQVTERTPERTIPFADAKDDIEEFLLEDTRNQATQTYVMELRAAATVEQLITLD